MRKTLLMNFTLAGVLFFYLFSLGDFTPIRALCYKVLPLMDTFRHPSNARLFVIIGSIVASVIIFDHFKKQKQFPKYFQIILIIALIAVLTSVIFFIGDSQIGSKLSELLASKDNLRIALKNFFAQLSVNDVVFLCGILQVIFLLLFLLLQRRITFHRWLPALFLINSFVFAQLTIPYTLASKVSPSKINALLNDYPKGYPKPDKNASLESNSLDALSNLELAGISGFYNKKINTTDLVYTPTFISSIGNTMADSFLKRTVLSNPYAYFAQTISSQADTCFSSCIISNDSALFNIKNPSKGDFELKKFWNNGFQFRITVKDTAVFCLQQLYLPGWKCSIDGRRANLHSANGSFMAVVIPKGFHDIKFIYKPAGTLFIFIFSILSWIIIIFLLIKNLREQNA